MNINDSDRNYVPFVKRTSTLLVLCITLLSVLGGMFLFDACSTTKVEAVIAKKYKVVHYDVDKYQSVRSYHNRSVPECMMDLTKDSTSICTSSMCMSETEDGICLMDICLTSKWEYHYDYNVMEWSHFTNAIDTTLEKERNTNVLYSNPLRFKCKNYRVFYYIVANIQGESHLFKEDKKQYDYFNVGLHVRVSQRNSTGNYIKILKR